MYRKGFTLIELLIVVAIIAILAAIAVPNFIEAQTRSKVARVKSDMRTLGTALPAYQTDHGSFPPNRYVINGAAATYGIFGLTSPVAYMTSIPYDPFQSQKAMFGTSGGRILPVFLHSFSSTKKLPASGCAGQYNSTPPYAPWPKDMYLLQSPGPDRVWDYGGVGAVSNFPNRYGATRVCIPYDASNGSLSNGDIRRWLTPGYFDIIFEVGYDLNNQIDPTNGMYQRWQTQ